MNQEPDRPTTIAHLDRTDHPSIHASTSGVPMGVEAAQAARLCGVSRATWYSLRKAGRVPRPVRLGRRVLWRVEELREWMAAGCPPLSRWDAAKKGRWV
jgi:predicted DNA-binding transcriptional regulator AlpA